MTAGCKIGLDRLSAVLERDDVIDLEVNENAAFRQVAILTPPSRTRPDKFAQGILHCSMIRLALLRNAST
jgi:hypothetical protein